MTQLDAAAKVAHMDKIIREAKVYSEADQERLRREAEEKAKLYHDDIMRLLGRGPDQVQAHLRTIIDTWQAKGKFGKAEPNSNEAVTKAAEQMRERLHGVRFVDFLEHRYPNQ